MTDANRKKTVVDQIRYVCEWAHEHECPDAREIGVNTIEIINMLVDEVLIEQKARDEMAKRVNAAVAAETISTNAGVPA